MKRYKTVILITLLMGVFSSAGCGGRTREYNPEYSSSSYDSETEKYEDETVKETDNSSSETVTDSRIITAVVTSGDRKFSDIGASNIINSGMCCSDGINYFYCDTNSHSLIQRTSSGDIVIDNNFYGYYLNLINDSIYYADVDNHYYITEYNLKTRVKNLILNSSVSELTLYNNKLYFSVTDNSVKSIYCMNTDGSERKILSSAEDIWYMTLYKDRIYFVDYGNDKYSLVSINTEGLDFKIILADNVSDLCIAEDRIFFAERDSRHLCSVNLDGTDLRKLNYSYSRCINYMDGELYYYSDENDGHTVYSCDLSGNITGKYASNARFLCLMQNTLFYYDQDIVLRQCTVSERQNFGDTSSNYDSASGQFSYGREIGDY